MIINNEYYNEINSRLYSINFETLDTKEHISYKDLFTGIAVFGEMEVNLIVDDRQSSIVDAAKMIKMPHVSKISIAILDLHNTKFIEDIKESSHIANEAKAEVTIMDEDNQKLSGRIKIQNHKVIILELKKHG